MREIVLDTETTGLDPFAGHRIVEIGCVELYNRIPSGRTFHRYVNPERDIPDEAHAVHGLSAEFLRDKPFFAEVADELIEFLGDAPLVIHNAAFDLAFVNAELDRVKRRPLGRERLIDTLMLARRRHPAGPNSLDHLCVRYGIDNTRRAKHGALLDAEILAEVYAELTGARQPQLILVDRTAPAAGVIVAAAATRLRPAPLRPRLSDDEHAAHLAFLGTLAGAPIWRDYLPEGLAA